MITFKIHAFMSHTCNDRVHILVYIPMHIVKSKSLLPCGMAIQIIRKCQNDYQMIALFYEGLSL